MLGELEHELLGIFGGEVQRARDVGGRDSTLGSGQDHELFVGVRAQLGAKRQRGDHRADHEWQHTEHAAAKRSDDPRRPLRRGSP